MGNEEIIQLKKISWFGDLPDEIIAALAQKVSKRNLSQDEILFHKGDVGDSLFIILAGLVKVITHDKDGNEIILNKVGTGEIIGEMALLDNESRSAGVVALEKTSALELSREDFMDTMKREPELTFSIIRNLSSRLRQNTTYIETLTDMSRRVAEGDYSFIGETQPVPKGENQENDPDTRVGQLMAEFIAMVKDIRKREDELIKQLQKLTLQIDEEKRKQEFEEITNTDFYANLKSQAKIIRSQRKDKPDNQ